MAAPRGTRDHRHHRRLDDLFREDVCEGVNMTIDRNSWHARMFIWWWEHKYGYGSFDRHQQFWGKSTNLCPYCRAVMFWGPLRLITMRCWFVFWPAVAAILNVLAIRKWGRIFWTTELKVIGITVLYVTAVVGTLVIIAHLKERFKKSRSKRRKPTNELPKSGPSFFELLRMKAQAAHSRICPLVEIR